MGPPSSPAAKTWEATSPPLFTVAAPQPAAAGAAESAAGAPLLGANAARAGAEDALRKSGASLPKAASPDATADTASNPSAAGGVAFLSLPVCLLLLRLLAVNCEEEKAPAPSAQRSGTAKWKVDPLPSSLSTQMPPPMSSARRLLMASPSPAPPYFRVMDSWTWRKHWKSLDMAAGEMPMPVSLRVRMSGQGSVCLLAIEGGDKATDCDADAILREKYSNVLLQPCCSHT
jgi:hypothetical protein